MKRRDVRGSINWIYFFPIIFVTFVVFIGNIYAPEIAKYLHAASGKTYYVSVTTGNDTNAGTQSAPFKTIGKGLFVALAGDTVRVLPGTYTEHIVLNGKNGQSGAPIRVVGDTTDTAKYPVIDGGDPDYTSTTKDPAITVSNSSWITFERLKVIHATDTAYRLDNSSHHIVIRRNIIDYHSSGVLLKNMSNHVLVEYTEMYQGYPDSSTWSQLKASKWEGGAVKSDGGAGMNVIRNNYFHHMFNGVFLTSGYKSGNYYDANVWIYKNRFEDVMDDPYEPETWAFNNHFFNNTLINTHRMTSFAPGESWLGPVYIYNNFQYLSKDPTGEASNGRINSAFKVDLSSNYYANGVYAFNNSVDMSSSGTNGYGIDMLNGSVHNFTHQNNAYRLLKAGSTKSALTLTGAVLTNDMTSTAFGYVEQGGYPNTDPGFANSSNEDLRLATASQARGRSHEVAFSAGFASSPVITTGADLGAFQYGESDFRNSPLPVYVTPPGGEYSGFAANDPWPDDTEGGMNPPSGPKWSASGAWVMSSTVAPSPTLATIPTSVVMTVTMAPTTGTTIAPTVISTPKPTLTPSSDGGPTITTTSLPIAKVGQPYSVTITATDPTKNDVLGMTISRVPNGLSFSSCVLSYPATGTTITCSLSGVLSKVSYYSVTFRVIDKAGNTAKKSFGLKVR
jgi:hypothetical protein